MYHYGTADVIRKPSGLPKGVFRYAYKTLCCNGHNFFHRYLRYLQYSIYWYWVTIRDLDAAGRSSNMEPVLQFILMFLYVGGIIFAINADENINAVRQQKGLPVRDNKILWIILSVIGLNIVAVGLIQNEINEIA